MFSSSGDMALEYTSTKCTANLPTNIVDFGGLDSSIILSLRGGIPRPMGDFPESLSQAMLVGIMLVGRLGVLHSCKPHYCGTSDPLEGLMRSLDGKAKSHEYYVHYHYHYY